MSEEQGRLRALRSFGLLEGAGPDLQAIVRVAAAVAGVPTATLNLIDDARQCQVATVGFVGQDGPRSAAMCDVTLREGQAQHVPDARSDPRFAANPWVTGELGSIVFYAAVPLTTADGWTLGTLCVFDDVERHLDAAQTDRLADCAHVAVALMERARTARHEQELAAEACEQRALLELVNQELEERHELLDTVLETVGVGIAVTDAEGRLTLFNRTCREWHGVDADPAVGPASWAETYRLFHADGVTPMAAVEVPLARALVGDEVDGVEMVIARDGEPSVVVVCAARRLVAAGRTIGAVVVMDDVTVRRHQEAGLRSSEQRFRSAFQQAPNPIALVSADDTWLDLNPAFCAWLGWSHDELLGTSAAALAHPDDVEVRQEAVQAVMSGRQDVAQLERRYRHRRGHHRWGRLSMSAVDGVDGTRQLICQVEDVTEQRAAQERLAHLALHDQLTGLPNRALLLERLQHALAVSRRDGSGHALLFCDLDGFKSINDRHGHAVGDEVLVEVARRFQRALRPSDTVARIGGDEFVVLCEQVASEPEVDGIVQRLEELVQLPVPTRGGEVVVGLSIGVCRPGPGQGAVEVIGEADRRMYETKQRRRWDAAPVRPRNELGLLLPGA